MRKAWVTGARGFVGRWLVEALRKAGWRVTTADRRGPADLVGDLRRVSLRDVRADVVFHLAAFAHPGASVEAAAEVYDVNVSATARLLREVRAGRFVLASTATVYRPSLRPLDETAPLRPRTPYAASKLCAEGVARASGRDVVILRPSNHTGPGQEEAYVCPRIARQVARAEAGGPRSLVLGDLAAARDFFDVRDMARAYILAAERGAAGAVYNVGTGRPVPIRRIVEVLVSLSRVALRVRAREGPSNDVLSCNPSFFRAATGWSAAIPLERTLADLLEHERSRAAGST